MHTQVLDGSVRDAVEKIGGELFAIVHRAEKPDAVTGRNDGCALPAFVREAVREPRSAEGKRESLHAGVEELDREQSVDDWPRLPDELEQPMFSDIS